MLEENLRLRAQLEEKRAVADADGVERTSVRDSERHLALLREVGFDVSGGVIAVGMFGVGVRAVAERTSG
jgi:hypothetical protein